MDQEIVKKCIKKKYEFDYTAPSKLEFKHMRAFVFAGLFVLLCACQSQKKEEHVMANPTVKIRTTEGDIQLELFANKAPETVKNFLRYVDEKHYNDTIFHRVIDGFMIQGGGMTADMSEKKTHEPIRNEANNGESNKRGTIAMARTSEVHSATAQFFINVVDNPFLDFHSPSPSGYGYCVFGKVTEGMDVVDKIKNVETSTKKGHQDVPIKAIQIIEIIHSN